MSSYKTLMTLRRDFPFEVGWHESVSRVASEPDWLAAKLVPEVLDLFGPQKLENYGEYCEAIGRIQPDRLMLYVLWLSGSTSTEIAHVRSARFGTNVEGGDLPKLNDLFRETIARAEVKCGVPVGTGSSLRPKRTAGQDTAAKACLIHDRATALVYVTDWPLGYRIVKLQQGGDMAQTARLVMGELDGSDW